MVAGHLICDERKMSEWTPLRWTPRISSEGWDHGSLELMGIFPEASDTDIHLTVPDNNNIRGWTGYQPFAELKMWANSVQFDRRGQNVWIAHLACQGMLNPNRPKLRRIQGGGEIMQAGPISIPGGWRERVQVIQRTISVEQCYFQETIPDTTAVGQNASPDDAPTPPPNFFSSLPADHAVYHTPNGWVLMSRDYETLPGVTNAFLVRDSFIWEHEISPR